MKKINVFTAISILGLGSTLLFTACGTTSKIPENEETPIETHEEELVEEETEVEEELEFEAEPEDPPNILFAKNLQAELQSGNISNAISLFDNIPENLQDDEELKMLLASLYISNSEYDKANEVAQAILENDPNNVEAMELLTVSAKASGDTKSYNSLSKQILANDPYNVQANILQGEEYALNRKYKMARESFSKALKSEPDNPDALYGYALMSYYQDDIKGAKSACQRVLDNYPRDSQALAFMGKIAAEENNYVRATRYTLEAIKYDPENYSYHLDLGSFYGTQGKYQEAAEAWNKAVEIDPDYFLAYAYLAGCYDEQDNFEKALSNYYKVMETNPKYYYAYESAAILEYHLKNYDQAIKLFNVAYSYSKNYCYKLMMGACYYKKNDAFNAKKVLNEALKTLERDSTEYNMVRMFVDTYSRNAENNLVSKINKEDNSNKKGKMLFYLGLYYEIFGGNELANEYYAKVASMQAPMFFEYRIAKWGLE